MHIAGRALEGPSLPLHLITTYNEPARGCLQYTALVINSAAHFHSADSFQASPSLWSRDSCGERAKGGDYFQQSCILVESVFPPFGSARLGADSFFHKREGWLHVVQGDSRLMSEHHG